MTSRVTPKVCDLRERAGAGHELCPGERCALWDEPGCLVETVRVPLGHDLAAHLLDLRLELEVARDAEAASQAHRRFAERLNQNRE